MDAKKVEPANAVSLVAAIDRKYKDTVKKEDYKLIQDEFEKWSRENDKNID